MTRDEVLDLMYYAKTLADCKRAWEVRDAWLLQHPDDEAVLDEDEAVLDEDEAVLDEGEALYMHEQALKSMEEQKLREHVTG